MFQAVVTTHREVCAFASPERRPLRSELVHSLWQLSAGNCSPQSLFRSSTVGYYAIQLAFFNWISPQTASRRARIPHVRRRSAETHVPPSSYYFSRSCVHTASKNAMTLVLHYKLHVYFRIYDELYLVRTNSCCVILHVPQSHPCSEPWTLAFKKPWFSNSMVYGSSQNHGDFRPCTGLCRLSITNGTQIN